MTARKIAIEAVIEKKAADDPLYAIALGLLRISEAAERQTVAMEDIANAFEGVLARGIKVRS
jgi:hypothetical protein